MSRTKKYKKNRHFKKTKKYYGGAYDESLNQNQQQSNPHYVQPPKINEEPITTNVPINPNIIKNNNDYANTSNENGTIHELSQEGVFGIVGDKVSDVAKDVTDYAKTKALRLVGLEPIQENNETANEPNNEANTKPSQLSNELSAGISKVSGDLVKVADQTSSAIIQNINDVLKTPEVNETVAEAGKETTEIAKKLLNTFNASANNPEFKRDFINATNNLADYATIVTESMDEPINQSIDMLHDAGVKAVSGLASGAVRVIGDAAGAVPYVGAVVDIGKAVNDGSKAIGSVIESGTEAVQAASLVVEKTSESIKKKLQMLEEKKKQAQQIMDRTNNSINQFQNNAKIMGMDNQNIANNQYNQYKQNTTGGRTRKHKIVKNRNRFSKRVHFYKR